MLCILIAVHPILSPLTRLEILVTNLEVMFATTFLVVIESRMSVNESSCWTSPLLKLLAKLPPIFISFLCHCNTDTSIPTHVISTGYRLGQIIPSFIISLGVMRVSVMDGDTWPVEKMKITKIIANYTSINEEEPKVQTHKRTEWIYSIKLRLT